MRSVREPSRRQLTGLMTVMRRRLPLAWRHPALREHPRSAPLQQCPGRAESQWARTAQARAALERERVSTSFCEHFLRDCRSRLKWQTACSDQGHESRHLTADLHLNCIPEIASANPDPRLGSRIALTPSGGDDSDQAWCEGAQRDFSCDCRFGTGDSACPGTGKSGRPRSEKLRAPDCCLHGAKHQDQRDRPCQGKFHEGRATHESEPPAQRRFCCRAVTAGNMTIARNGSKTPTAAGISTWFSARRL